MKYGVGDLVCVDQLRRGEVLRRPCVGIVTDVIEPRSIHTPEYLVFVEGTLHYIPYYRMSRLGDK
jgi:hypothetical protein